MRDLDRAVLTFSRYGRGSNKRKSGDGTSTEKPSGDITAVKNFPTTTSLNAVESAWHKNRLLPGEVTAVNNSSPTTSSSAVESTSYDNRLLAGYLAHEFLTKGTLFGEQYDPARAEAVPVQEGSQGKVLEAEPNKGKARKLSSQAYAEVASLFRSEGTHIPGIVNPSELARWIRL